MGLKNSIDFLKTLHLRDRNAVRWYTELETKVDLALELMEDEAPVCRLL